METWHNVQNVPQNDHSTGAKLDHLFGVCRYRVLGMKLPGGGRYVEYKIPCQYGEVYPVGAKTWGWCGESTYIAKKIMRLLDKDAAGPFGLSAILSDESVIWFPASRVEEVLAAARARRRRAPGSAANLKTRK